MKKLILILSIFLVSCGYYPIHNYKPIIITDIEKSDSLYCYYYGYGENAIITNNGFKFRDTCGKFQIGDTLNIVKQ